MAPGFKAKQPNGWKDLVVSVNKFNSTLTNDIGYYTLIGVVHVHMGKECIFSEQYCWFSLMNNIVRDLSQWGLN